MSSVRSTEARRRKIKERGSDRLALITGRIQTLPPFTDPSPPSVNVFPREEIQAYPAELLRDECGGNVNKIDVNLSLDNPEFPLLREGNECKSEGLILAANDVPVPSLSPSMCLDNPEFHLQKSRAGNQCEDEAPILEVNDVPEPSSSPPVSLDHPKFPLQKSRAGSECKGEAAILELNNDPEPSLSSSASREVSHPVLHAESPSSSIPHQLKSFSYNPSELHSAVDRTVNARMLFSVLVAILVVLSNMGFPLMGGKITRSLLMFRPLYLVLLTNIMLVVARMMLTQQLRTARSVNGEGKGLPGGDNDWVNQIGNNLELGYLLMKLIDAVMMDCSLYLAIVVCGTCLARLVTS